jgi:hypothetical protein
MEDNPALAAMVQHLLDLYGPGINSALLYGSCLRSGDIFDGLLDIYLICDSYTQIYTGRLIAIANRLLPPNVFYGEIEHEGRVLRSKYSIISSADFARGCSQRRFESYIWGRFSQPVKLVYSRDADSRMQLENSLIEAAATFLSRTLPLMPAQGSVGQLWKYSLARSYATELRTERAGRAQELAEASQDFYRLISLQVAGRLGPGFELRRDDTGELNYRCRTSGWRHTSARLAWATRRLQGKLMSILRLLKALFTFEGGLDYVAWKLERHSGVEVVIPDRVRRYPLIFMWRFFWGLYRQGAFK